MTREGVWNPNGEGEQPDIPGGVAKDLAREKKPVIAYAVLYHRLAEVARAHGYALAMHGSLVADCDLVAVPWTADADCAATLVESLALAAPGILLAHDPARPRPHGRESHVIHLGGGPYLDIAVMPRAAIAAPQPLSPTDDRARCKVCGWPLDPTGKFCRPDNCSQRPLPVAAVPAPTRSDATHLSRLWVRLNAFYVLGGFSVEHLPASSVDAFRDAQRDFIAALAEGDRS